MSHLAEGPVKKGLFSKALTFIGKTGEQDPMAPNPMPAEPTFAKTVLPTGPARALSASHAPAARYPEAASPFSSAYGEVDAMPMGASHAVDLHDAVERPMSMTELTDEHIVEAIGFVADNLRRDHAEKVSAAEATLTALKFTLDARGLRMRQSKSAAAEASAKNLQLEGQLQDVDLKYRSALADAQHFQQEFRDADQRAKLLTTDLQETSHALASVQDTVRELSSRCQTLEQELKAARQVEEQQRQAATEATQTITRLEQQVATLSAQLAEVRASAATQDAAIRRYQLTAESLRTLVANLPVALAAGVPAVDVIPASVPSGSAADALLEPSADGVVVIAPATDSRTPVLAS